MKTDSALRPDRLVEVRQTKLSVIVMVTCKSSSCEEQLLSIDPGGVLRLLDEPPVKNVVVDCGNLALCSMEVVAFLLRLRSRIASKFGRMALCSVSDQLLEKLQLLHLADMWPTFDSLPTALEYLEKQ